MKSAFTKSDVLWSYKVDLHRPEYAEYLRASDIVMVEVVERHIHKLRIDLDAYKKALRR